LKIGELVMEPARVYTYDREVNSIPFILDILTGFRYIKSLDQRIVHATPEQAALIPLR
jgi:hypothetical protein